MSTRISAHKEIIRAEAGSRKKFNLLLVLLLCACLGSLFLACLLGHVSIPARGVAVSILQGLGLGSAVVADETWKVVVFDIRLSRICLAMLVGLALAVAGTVFQGLLRNPLADPFTLGVSTGAAFGASAALFAGAGSREFLGLGLLPSPPSQGPWWPFLPSLPWGG